jgi:hypothetical protein
MFQYDLSLTNQQLFNPVNTGSPRLDLYHHIARLPQPARLDVEAHTVAGDLIIRIEPDLGGAEEDDTRILALPYALRFFGHHADAVEFTRCVKLIAGEDARPFNLQTIAAHYYREARTCPAAEVLKEMALLALQLGSVTASAEEREYCEPEESEVLMLPAPCSLAERRAAFFQRAAQVLGENEAAEEDDLFAAECRALARYGQRTAGFAYDEFAAHLATQEAACTDLDEVDALYASFEATYEQYDEGHLVSLHMQHGERVIVAGRLDDDLDETHLPPAARHLAAEMYHLYTNGFPLQDAGEQSGVEGVVLKSYQRDRQTGERYAVPLLVCGLDTWLHYAVEAVYHERVTRTQRQLLCVPQPEAPPRTFTRPELVAAGPGWAVQEATYTVPATLLHEQTYLTEICPGAAERDQARALLETLLARWQRDFQTRALHASPSYRDLAQQLQAAQDTAEIARLKQEAWQHKEARQLPLKHFTALMTQASARQAHLESQPWRVTREEADVTRSYLPAQPLLNRIPSLKGGTLGALALALHSLPRQEQERVRAAFQAGHPTLYARVRDGLQAELKKASAGKLRYFRWACYAQNKPEHPFHTLTQTDRAAAWELLKALSQQPAPASATRPQQPLLPGLAQARPQPAGSSKYAAGH